MFGNIAENIISYGKYFASPQISVKTIRKRQDAELTGQVIKQAKRKMKKNSFDVVTEPLFFVGSVDFMVKNDGKEKTYYILEANGGNSRGFSAMDQTAWMNANKCFAESLSFVGSKNPVVVISHPNKDLLMYEKIMLAEYLAEKMKKNHPDSEIIHVDNLTPKVLKKGNLIILGPYKDILPRLSMFKNNYVYFDGKQVDILIGDGIVRRKPEIIKHLLNKELKSLVVNDIFVLTDDKALTYLAVEEAAASLRNFNVEPIAFKRAKNRKKLEKNISGLLDNVPEILIKPHGGSGGSGIDIIVNEKDKGNKIDSSIKHYREKFGAQRDPYPYTVCQRVEATPVVWNDALHHFDIRVYVGRIKDRVQPLGALIRIALEPFAGRFTKKSFVVNLSGYEGVDTDRGFGLSRESLKLFNLDENDYANMFAAACTLVAYMNNNYTYLMKKAADIEKS